MSKKTNKTCKLEQVNTTPNSNKTAECILVGDTKSPAQPPKPNAPTSLTKVPKVNSSPRMTPNNSTTNLNSTAEKRGKLIDF